MDRQFDDCPRWGEFLGRIFDGKPRSVILLQQWMGYLVGGDTDQHKTMLVVGPPRSGKGVLNRTIAALIGPDRCVDFTLSQLTEYFTLSRFVGKTVAFSSDCRVSPRDSPGVRDRILSIVGQDKQIILAKNAPDAHATLPVRFHLTGNELPSIFSDPDSAMSRRLLRIALSRSFLGREIVNLTDSIASEIDAIHHWAAIGYERLQIDGQFFFDDSEWH